MTNPTTIARSLSEAQRRMIVEIDRGQPREYTLSMPGFALMKKNLVFVNELGARHLTDKGHAVRAAILAEQEQP